MQDPSDNICKYAWGMQVGITKQIFLVSDILHYALHLFIERLLLKVLFKLNSLFTSSIISISDFGMITVLNLHKTLSLVCQDSQANAMATVEKGFVSIMCRNYWHREFNRCIFHIGIQCILERK